MGRNSPQLSDFHRTCERLPVLGAESKAQLPERITDAPLWVLSEDKVGTHESHSFEDNRGGGGEGLHVLSQILPSHSNYNSQIKPLENPEVV